ncbi:porin [Novosphingobium umbonatum]|uniref:Porin n=1 Tax=Novosphingobium umbonatum TaxID=1908524 RepID=A0A3S2VQS5_9SPHN|nr:porin [Novosphingobium umbonatum]RVU03242.1 porin [Novosphingobium umbonatum]
MTGIKTFKHALMMGVAALVPQQALARTSAETREIRQLKREVEELKQQMRALTEAAAAAQSRAATPAPAAVIANAENVTKPVVTIANAAPVAAAAPVLAAAPAPVAAPHAPAAHGKVWYEKLMLRGYTQFRVNEILSGADTAPSGVSRLRSVQDAALSDKGNFSIRRARLVVQGDISSRVSLYMQGDLASSVSNQTSSEKREGFFQMRDAYADVYLDKHRTFKLRFGQSKVPVGWENMQSSSNRLALDRSDAIDSAVPGERDMGVVAYYTPARVQHIWDRLAKDGQKLFGNYGAFGLGLYNGQGVNRTESNNGLMKVAFVTWPVELGGAFKGQVIEFGGSLMQNKIQPEIRTGGVSAIAYNEKRVSLHAMLYPKPFGLQAEWTWGQTPAWDKSVSAMVNKGLDGGYVQAMYRLPHTAVGQIMPFARWQYYRGGWKGSVNSPFLETDELELGVEWQPMKEVEFTVTYSDTKRSEADERRSGQAHGQLVRAQVQWNY